MIKLKAFTLVEVMLSVMILGVGLIVIVNSYLVALRGINASGNNVQAMTLAKEKLDELELSNLTQKGLSALSTSDIIKVSGKDYNYTLDITEADQPGYISRNLVKACLTFSWQERNAKKDAIFSAYFPEHKEEAPPKSL